MKVLLVKLEVVYHVVAIFALLQCYQELFLQVAQAALVLAVPLMEALGHEVIALVDVNEVLTMMEEPLMEALMLLVEQLLVVLTMMVEPLMVALMMMVEPLMVAHVNAVAAVVKPSLMWEVDPKVELLHQVVACIVVVVVVVVV